MKVPTQVKCKDPALLTDEELAEICKLLPAIKNWIVSVEAYALSRAMIWQLPGFKAVEGRTVRKWESEEEAMTTLERLGYAEDAITTTKVISPAQAEKLVGKEVFEEKCSKLLGKVTGKPTLASVEDNRPALGNPF